jgi:2-oxoglutarate dehydrogenase E2 component (dihydrolipoamide succinyltransferase)
MSVSVVMPQLGESVTEGTVTRWLKQVGDTVTADEPLLEVSTDKVDTEIPSPASGVILEILAAEDSTIAVGGVLAIIGESNEAGTAAPAAAPAAPVEAAVVAPVAEAVATPAPSSSANATEVKMPALGESVTEGTITRWLKQVGDTVAADEALLEVSTDKVDTEIPSPVSGTLLSINAAEDSTVPVGSLLAVIGSANAAAVTPAAAPTPAPVAAAPVASPTPVVATPPAAPVAAATPAPAAQPAASTTSVFDNSDSYVTPLVRKIAVENNVDLAVVQGSGIGGRIRKQDVLDYVAARQPAASAPAVAPAAKAPAVVVVDSNLRGRTEKLSRLRKVIAQRMVESLHVSAQLTSVAEVDVSNIVSLRERNKSSFESKEGVKLTYMPFFVKAAVDTLKGHPTLNASMDIEAGTVTYHDSEHLAFAVDTDKGLLVPVIRNAGDLSIAGLARHISDLAARTRTGQVAPDELSGGSFTLTNTGSRGALFDTPIINQPQVAILGVGAIVKRAVVVTDEEGRDLIAVRHMVYLSLTYDHRLVDGADAARYLVAIKARLESGAFDL